MRASKTFLLDARCLSKGGDAGADRVVRQLVRRLPAQLREKERLVILARSGILDGASLSGSNNRVSLVCCDIPSASAKQHLELPRVVSAIGPDVWVYPQYDLPPIPSGTRAISLVYDLTPLEEPAYFGPGRAHRALLASALYGEHNGTRT